MERLQPWPDGLKIVAAVMNHNDERARAGIYDEGGERIGLIGRKEPDRPDALLSSACHRRFRGFVGNCEMLLMGRINCDFIWYC